MFDCLKCCALCLIVCKAGQGALGFFRVSCFFSLNLHGKFHQNDNENNNDDNNNDDNAKMIKKYRVLFVPTFFSFWL